MASMYWALLPLILSLLPLTQVLSLLPLLPLSSLSFLGMLTYQKPSSSLSRRNSGPSTWTGTGPSVGYGVEYSIGGLYSVEKEVLV